MSVDSINQARGNLNCPVDIWWGPLVGLDHNQ